MCAVNTPDEIGQAGEDAFARLASQGKIICHPPRKDRRGWDFCLELPRAYWAEGNVTLDLVPSEIRAWAQVKTLTSEDGRCSIALSQWKRMVEDPHPWFIAVIIVDERLRETAAYLVHVDESWCARVLEQLRGLHPEDLQFLHKHSLEVSWSDRDSLRELHGDSLREAIRYHAGDDPTAYAEQKLAWFRETGYDDAPYDFLMTIDAGGSDVDELGARFAVGAIDKLPVRGLKIDERRFGIVRPLVETIFEEGGYAELKGRTPDGVMVISISSVDRGATLDLRCRTYSSASIFPDLPRASQKYRFVDGLVELIVERRPDGISEILNWRLSAPESPSCIGEFRSVARLALLLHKSHNRPLVLSLRPENGGPLETVEDIRGNEPLDPQALRMWRTIDRFCDLAQRFWIHDGERVGRRKILEHSEAIDFLHSALFAPGATATFNASLEGAPQELREAHEMAALSCPYVVLEHQVLGACIALVGSPSLQRIDAARWMLSIATAKVRVMREFVLPHEGYAARGSQAIFTEAREILNAEGISVVVHPSEAEDAVAG